jgi:hypothetical protein
MLGTTFYHGLIRKYVTIFGTLFNNIVIEQGEGDSRQKLRVPLAYGPREKFLSRIEGNDDAGSHKTAIKLPRIGFSFTSFTYAPQRKVATLNKIYKTSEGNRQFAYAPVPYDVTVNMGIIAKTIDEANRITEQILPYFTPEFTVSAKLIEDLDEITDIPIVLNSVVMEDNYDGPYDERRTIIVNLDFTMKILFFGPVSTSKIIKFVDVNFKNPETRATFSNITIQPGLTANGEPTTDIGQTIPFTDIEPDDNWAYIIRIDEKT